jgi:hypothetical protein
VGPPAGQAELLRLSGAGRPPFESRNSRVEFSCRIASENTFAVDGLLLTVQAPLVLVNPIAQFAYLAADVVKYNAMCDSQDLPLVAHLVFNNLKFNCEM